jgi:hypothetical protein
MAVPAKRSTTHQAAKRQRTAANGAVLLNRLEGIRGTRRSEPASARVHRREEQLVAAYTAEHDALSEIDDGGPVGR